MGIHQSVRKECLYTCQLYGSKFSTPDYLKLTQNREKNLALMLFDQSERHRPNVNVIRLAGGKNC